MHSSHHTEQWFNPSQLHTRWGFHPESIRRMVRQGRLPACRIGKRLLVSRTDIEAFEQDHRVQPHAKGGYEGSS
jgi:excisionase family DNA binding protein